MKQRDSFFFGCLSVLTDFLPHPAISHSWNAGRGDKTKILSAKHKHHHFALGFTPLIFCLFFLSANVICHAAQKKALLIGINDYGDPKKDLHGCVNDCMAFKAVLLKPPFQFKNEDILTLFDRQATMNNILSAFSEFLVKGSQPGDLVVMYYSGHGSRSYDAGGDEADHFDEGIVPCDCNCKTGKNFLVDDLITQYFGLLSDREFIAFFDSCHSGTANRGLKTSHEALEKYCEMKYSAAVKSIDMTEFRPTRYGLEKSPGKGVSSTNLFFAAARDVEPALEIKVGGINPRGAFTFSLVKGLSGLADLNKDGIITYRELYAFTKSDVQKAGLTQIPQLDPASADIAGSILDQPVFRSGPEGASALKPPALINANLPNIPTHVPQQHHEPPIGVEKPSVVKPPLVSKPPVQNPPANVGKPGKPPAKTDSGVLNIFLQEDLEPCMKDFFKGIPFVRFCESVDNRDLSLRLVKDGGKFSGSIYDLSDLVSNRFTESSRESLAKKLGSVFEGRLLQKKLGNLTSPESSFQVKLEVAGNTEKFHEGEKVVYSFSISHDCFLYIIDIQPDGRVNLLFPNPYRRENFLTAGKYTLPGKADTFDFEVSAPFGNELVKAIAIKDKEAARKLGLPVPGDDFISYEGNPFAENSKAREFATSIESDVTEIGNSAASADAIPISLSQVTYQTRGKE